MVSDTRLGVKDRQPQAVTVLHQFVGHVLAVQQPEAPDWLRVVLSLHYLQSAELRHLQRARVDDTAAGPAHDDVATAETSAWTALCIDWDSGPGL